MHKKTIKDLNIAFHGTGSDNWIHKQILKEVQHTQRKREKEEREREKEEEREKNIYNI